MIQEEIAGIRREIDQARDLVRDAIEKLTAGFARIGELTAPGAVEDVRTSAILNEVSSVVTALQFQDMVEQLLVHTLKRLDAVEKALEAGETLAPGRREPINTRPVAQRHLDPGDVELF